MRQTHTNDQCMPEALNGTYRTRVTEFDGDYAWARTEIGVGFSATCYRSGRPSRFPRVGDLVDLRIRANQVVLVDKVDNYDDLVQDIKSNPSKHKHRSMEELQACCILHGALDAGLLDAHSRYAPIGYNGKPCDVYSGPCSCGAWH